MFFFFNDTATTEIYTLSLHDALPISRAQRVSNRLATVFVDETSKTREEQAERSEEHTSELQSQSNLVCRLLLEKKKTSAKSSIMFRLGVLSFSSSDLSQPVLVIWTSF